MKESQCKEVALKDIPSGAFEILLEYMYGGAIGKVDIQVRMYVNDFSSHAVMCCEVGMFIQSIILILCSCRLHLTCWVWLIGLISRT